MRRRLIRASVLFVVVFAGAQLVGPDRTNPATDPARAIRAHVAEGRRAVNYSEWGGYSPGQQRTLMAASCDDASTGRMPGGAWTLLHPEARLSSQDIETICAAARQVDTNKAEQR
jgi:hypothetical protein